MSVFSYIIYQVMLFDKVQMMALISPKISEYQKFISCDIGATDTKVNVYVSFCIGCSFSLDTRLEGQI